MGRIVNKIETIHGDIFYFTEIFSLQIGQLLAVRSSQYLFRARNRLDCAQILTSLSEVWPQQTPYFHREFPQYHPFCHKLNVFVQNSVR